MQRTIIRSKLAVELCDKLPESKLELINSGLLAGNNLAGSHYLLWAMLQACGPQAALPFAWCPEAKFELLEGLPHIGSWDSTPKVLGLLLMTFGLVETVSLLHPHEWVAALLEEEQAHHDDLARRDTWWRRTREAAALLGERFDVQRVTARRP